MSEEIQSEKNRLRFNEGCSGCGCVLTVGLVLSLFGLAIGGGCSVRIPITDINITSAGSIGNKAKTELVLPSYAAGLLGDNTNFINQSHSLTIGPVQGTEIFIVGKQLGSPLIDLQLNLK